MQSKEIKEYIKKNMVMMLFHTKTRGWDIIPNKIASK